MSKHTQGPWRYSTEPQPNGCPIIGAGPLMVAMVSHSVKDPTQRETALANARLIAAGPDLMEASRMLIDSIEGGSTTPEDAITAARAAIAKATGEA